VLLAVVKLRLGQAEEQARIVLEQETKRLAPEDFSAAEIEGSTRVKRANGRVSNWQTIQKRVETEPLEATWKIFTPRVLSEK